MTFTDSASRLGGMAGLLLGWRPREFWAATPMELAAILKVAADGERSGGGLDGETLKRLKEMYPDG